jgi:ribosome-associated protein
MLEINENLSLSLAEIDWSYARSGGPGGQNVNKVSSKAVLRWPMATSPALPDWVKARLAKLFPSRLTTEGDIVISSQEFRDQERNREACLAKLAEMIRAALVLPKPRIKKKPTKASKERRLAEKKRQSQRREDRRVGE